MAYNLITVYLNWQLSFTSTKTKQTKWPNHFTPQSLSLTTHERCTTLDAGKHWFLYFKAIFPLLRTLMPDHKSGKEKCA